MFTLHNFMVHVCSDNKGIFYSILECVDIRKATGEDKSDQYIFLKICAPCNSDELTYLFNMSISSGVFPNIWKAAHVVPLHKGGDKADPNNYRPFLNRLVLLKSWNHESISSYHSSQYILC